MNEVTPHNGIIELGIIENIGDNADQVGLLTAQFVHYPDCQQLQIWLPESKYQKWDFGNYQLINKSTQIIEDQGLVEHKTSGSVQLLFDTIGLSEGYYLLEIEHPQKGKHVLHFQKHGEDVVPEKPKPIEPPSTDENLWRVYKDGFGKDIPNEDWAMRQKSDAVLSEIFESAFEKNTEILPRLKFTGNGRAGSIFYIDESIHLEFWYEMGGNDCKMYIDIPDETSWVQTTNTPLSKRREILLFVANTVRHEQAPSWRFEIRDNEIAFY